MTENRLLAVWQRLLAGLVALAGVVALSACGGGSGSPNNSFNTPGPLTVLPAIAVAYSGQPIELTISGGTPPYRAFSANQAVLPVTQSVSGSTIVLLPANVTADTDVSITVQDSPNTTGTVPANTSATLTVRAAPMLNSLTITPSSAECGTNAICSGQDGTATVTALGPQGGALAGHQIQFDVVSGSFVVTAAGQPPGASVKVFSDSNGVASVIVRANVGAPTQFAQLRATDLTSGQQLLGNFLIQQVTDGSKILSIVPGTATISTAFTGVCSTGFTVEYFIYGGTPPYHVASTFPAAISLSNSTVNANGGSFLATTNGTCVDPLTFSIVDATGRQTTATLTNKAGSGTAPAPVPLAITPNNISPAGTCTGKTFLFIASGGTPSYGAIVSPTPPAAAAVVGNQVSVSGIVAAGTYNVTLFDASSSTPATATINCP